MGGCARERTDKLLNRETESDSQKPSDECAQPRTFFVRVYVRWICVRAPVDAGIHLRVLVRAESICDCERGYICARKAGCVRGGSIQERVLWDCFWPFSAVAEPISTNVFRGLAKILHRTRCKQVCLVVWSRSCVLRAE